MRRVVPMIVAIALYGCASGSSVRNGVRVTHNVTDVERCRHIGAVQSVPPYSQPGEDLERIRNRAIEIGADTVLLGTLRNEPAAGIAYRCKTS